MEEESQNLVTEHQKYKGKNQYNCKYNGIKNGDNAEQEVISGLPYPINRVHPPEYCKKTFGGGVNSGNNGDGHECG